jgi:hypothetical protein
MSVIEGGLFPNPARTHLLAKAGGALGLGYVSICLIIGRLHDLRPLPLTARRRRLERLLGLAKVPCLQLVEAFDVGEKLLEVTERHRLEGVVSKRRSAPYRSGECRDWREVKTAAWRVANRERWRLFAQVGGRVGIPVWVGAPALTRLSRSVSKGTLTKLRR